jgi:hypothetical protein
MTDEQIRQRAVSIAVEAAEADTIQTYTSERPFVPHEWVVRAIAKALKERTPVQVGRAVTDVITEIVERATASVREASDRNAELIARRSSASSCSRPSLPGTACNNSIAERSRITARCRGACRQSSCASISSRPGVPAPNGSATWGTPRNGTCGRVRRCPSCSSTAGRAM